MLPSSPAVSYVQQVLRLQDGVVEAVRTGPDQQLLLTVGEQVQATVTAQLPGGRFAVLVKDQLLDLNLPRNTQPGEKLDLTVLSNSPQLSFLLNVAAEDMPTPGVQLSQTARMLVDLQMAGNSGQQSGQAAKVTVQQATPLFEGEPVPAQLAGQLASRLADSGLFYESHQAEWVNGERPLQTLMREPQASLPSATVLSSADASVPADKKMAATTDTTAAAIRSAQADPTQTNTVRPEETLRQIVHQQLGMLEDRPLVWLGQAWAGQTMQWQTEVKDEGHAATGEADASARSWQTRLDMKLPNLGDVGVTAVLYQGQFRLRFAAESIQTQQLLQQHLGDLSGQFSAAGLNLAAANVTRSLDEES